MIWLHLYGAAVPLFPHLNGLMSRPISEIVTFRHFVCPTNNFRAICLRRCLPSVCNPWDAHWLVPGQRPTCSATSHAGRDLSIPRHERKTANRMRSFRRRQAAITKRQRQQLRDLEPKHGLAKNFKNRWNFDDIFSTQPGTAVTLDIGFGSGESLLEMALARPAESFVGIEVHKPGVAKALERIEAEAMTNVKIVLGDAVTALCDNVEDRSLDECCIFFPEPFPLARDSERRLVRPLLLSLLSHKMRFGGVLSIATDVEEYANHITRVMSPFLIPPFAPEVDSPYVRRSNTELKEELRHEASSGTTQQLVGRRSKTMVFPSGGIWVGGETAERPPCRPVTRYEEKARAADRTVHDFRYRLVRPLDDGLSAPR